MRVLFSTTAGSGHFGPLIPFAKACRDAGQMVKVAAPASFATDVSRAGLDHAPFDDVPSDVIGPLFGRLPEMSFEQANATVIGEIFGRLDARAALPGVAEIVDHWKPDVVVREPCEFASLVAAERAPDMPMRVLLTTGRGIDPASLGPIPANIHVEQWWPQADVMPHNRGRRRPRWVRHNDDDARSRSGRCCRHGEAALRDRISAHPPALGRPLTDDTAASNGELVRAPQDDGCPRVPWLGL